MSGPGDILPDGDQVELAASALEAISTRRGLIGGPRRDAPGSWLSYNHLPLDGELADLLRSMDAEDTVVAKMKLFPKMALIKEVGQELLGKGLKRQ